MSQHDAPGLVQMLIFKSAYLMNGDRGADESADRNLENALLRFGQQGAKDIRSVCKKFRGMIVVIRSA